MSPCRNGWGATVRKVKPPALNKGPGSSGSPYGITKQRGKQGISGRQRQANGTEMDMRKS